MTNEQKQTLITEFRNERHISSQVTDEQLMTFFEQAAFFLNSLVSNLDINFDVDLNARRLAKVHMYYDYYGALDEFRKRYIGEIYETQISYL